MAGSLVSAMPAACGRHRSGWLATAAVFLLFFVVFGPLYNYSILFVSLRDEFGSSAAVTGWVGSTANGLSCFFSPLAGLLRARLGYRPVFVLAVCFYSLGFLLASYSPSILWAFPTIGVLTAMGAGTIMHTGTSLLFDWFPQGNNARAISFSLVGTAAGMLAYAPLMTTLTALYGWRTLLRILAGSALAIGALDTLLLGSPPPSDSTPGKEGDEEEKGRTQKATGTTTATTSTPSPLPLLADKATATLAVEMDRAAQGDEVDEEADAEGATDTRTRSGQKDGTESGAQTSLTLWKAISRLDVWLLCIAVCISTLSFFFFTINCASYMRTLDFTPDQTALVMVLFSLGEIVSKLATALLGDHLPCLMTDAVTAATLISALASALTGFARSLSSVITLAIVSGFMRGVFCGIIFSAGLELFPEYGGSVATSLVLVPWGLGIFLTAPLTGGLFDVSGNYTLSLCVLGALFAMSSLLTATISIRRMRMRRARADYAGAGRNGSQVAPRAGETELKAIPVDGTENRAYDGNEVD